MLISNGLPTKPTKNELNLERHADRTRPICLGEEGRVERQSEGWSGGKGVGGMENSAVAALWLVRPDHGVILSGISQWKLTRSEHKFMSSHPWMTLAQAHVCADAHAHKVLYMQAVSLCFTVRPLSLCLGWCSRLSPCRLCSPSWRSLYFALACLCQVMSSLQSTSLFIYTRFHSALAQCVI